MTKRPKLPAFSLKDYGGPTGAEGIEFMDRAPWLGDDERELSALKPWIEAIERLDKRGDKAPLTSLLRSKRGMPDKAREFLADLIERGVARPPNRPRTPAYNMSDADAKMFLAAKDVRGYLATGMDFDAAVAKAAKDWSIKIDALENHCKGKRGASNRRKKRLPPSAL